MSDEGTPRSRFRRSSRFKKPKTPPIPGAPEQQPLSERPVPVNPFAPPVTESAPVQDAHPIQKEEVETAPETVKVNAITVDVMEWFQSAAFSGIIKFSHWSKYERRVERGIHLLTALLRQHSVKGTFFILGIAAREFPEMVRLIKNEGHEIGVCGYYNRLLYTISPQEYINELEMSLSLLKSLTNTDIVIHRAPGFSINRDTLWVMDVLKTYGIKYDSSICSVKADLYGIEGAPRFPYTLNPQGIIEFPPSTYPFLGKNIELFKGTNFRVVPYPIISMGVESINKQGFPVMVNVTPWEIEAEIPRIDLGWDESFAQYAGLKNTFPKLARLLEQYEFSTLTEAVKEHKSLDSLHIQKLRKQE